MTRVYGDLHTPGTYRDTADIAKDLRAAYKAMRKAGRAGGGVDLPTEAKVSVRISRFSGGSSIDVTIMAPAAWVYVAPGAPEGPEYYHQPAHGGHTLDAQLAVLAFEAEMARHNYDGSDVQTDYFDVNFYGHVDVRVLGDEYGPKVDRSGATEPVAIGQRIDRYDAQRVFDETPYAIRRAERQAYAEEAAREAAAAESAAEMDAAAAEFAAELDGDDALAGVAEAEIIAGVQVASAAELAEERAEIEAYADAIGDEALAEEAIAREPDTYRVTGYERRSIEATWVLTWHDEARTQPHEVTQLMVHHHKGRGYTASLHRGTVGQPTEGNPLVGTLYADMMTAPQVGELIPGQRFNRKHLIAATKTKVAEVMADPAQYLHKFKVTQGAGVF